MNARRFASLAGTVAVTAIAAVASYDHMRELALAAGQSPLLATLLPLSVDGMILVATMALGDGRASKWSAWLAFTIGVVASLAANVMAARPDLVSRVVSAWPAVALLLTVEILTRAGQATDVAATATGGQKVVNTVSSSATPAPDLQGGGMEPKLMAGPGGQVLSNQATATGTARPVATPRPAVATDDVAARVVAILAERPSASAADVAAAIGRAERTARRYMATAKATMATA